MKRSKLSAAVITLACSTCALAADNEAPSHETIDRLIGGVQNNDLAALMQHATPQMKAGLTQDLLNKVSHDLAPHLQAGYATIYLGDLKQHGMHVQLWKLTFKDGRDDALVRLALQGDDVAGFFIQ